MCNWIGSGPLATITELCSQLAPCRPLGCWAPHRWIKQKWLLPSLCCCLLGYMKWVLYMPAASKSGQPLGRADLSSRYKIWTRSQYDFFFFFSYFFTSLHTRLLLLILSPILWPCWECTGFGMWALLGCFLAVWYLENLEMLILC